MWDRAQVAARALLARTVRAVGTRELSIALLVLAGVHALAVEAWGRIATPASADAFATAWSAWLLAGLIAVDATVHLSRRLPETFPGWFQHAASPAPAPRRSGVRAGIAATGRLSLASAWLLVGIGLLASLSLRDRFTLWLGDGERFEGNPGQVVARAQPRWLASEPKPLDFTVAGIWPHADARGNVESLDIRLMVGSRATSTSLWRPTWLGGGRFIRASGFGLAPRFEVADPSGRIVDSAFVKLDVLPVGRVDHVRSEVLPHRFYVQLAPGEPLRGGGADVRGLVFQVEALRGKRLVASGAVRANAELPFEGFSFRIPEVRHVARLVLVDDPGVPILVAAALLALLGVVLGRAAGDPSP